MMHKKVRKQFAADSVFLEPCPCDPMRPRKAMQSVVKTAERITGTLLPSISDMAYKCCLARVRSIVRDATHPLQFSLLSSGKRLHGI